MDENDEGMNQSPADKFKILISTDNHLGYLEKDPVRGNDSFNSFEEVLSLAQENKVDFILLGGDLFHDNKPSRECLYKTMNLLRKYCLGDSPCHMDFQSDQSENFPTQFATVNYQDPNFNVAIPVFSIHGNHDDPSGHGNLCALDLLSVAGLVNYFGKQDEIDNIHVKPILLQKGESKLALYGLGNVRDERLNRTFKNKKVVFYRPSEDTKEWFNLLVIHQNRIAHSANNYIPETFLDPFIDLVLWGHEHECRIAPEESVVEGTYITQPGSSVATSLCEGESVPKHCGLLEIDGPRFALKYLKLKTVRPFAMDTIVLSTVPGLDMDDKIALELFLEKKDMIKKTKTQWREENPSRRADEFPLPLIRLRIDYSDGYTTTSPFRLGQTFMSSIANPKDLITFFRKLKVTTTKKTQAKETVDLNELLPDEVEDNFVESLIQQNLQDKDLQILPENELTDVISNYVTKQENDAIVKYVTDILSKTMGEIELASVVDDDKRLTQAIIHAKEERFRVYQESVGTKSSAGKTGLKQRYDFENTQRTTVKSLGIKPDDGFEDAQVMAIKRTSVAVDAAGEENEEEEADNVDIDTPPTQKKRKAPAKGTKATKAAPKKGAKAAPVRKRKPKPVSSEEESQEEIEDVEELSEPGPPVKRARAALPTRVETDVNFGTANGSLGLHEVQGKKRQTRKNPFAQ